MSPKPNHLKDNQNLLRNSDAFIKRLNEHGNQGLNAMTISELTSIPRPTVLRKLNLDVVKGSRFYHICSGQNKGKALLYFLNKLKLSSSDKNYTTVGVGDSYNDIDMLSNVDYPCIVRSSDNHNLAKKIKNQNTIVSESSAPQGWEECINHVFSKILIGTI